MTEHIDVNNTEPKDPFDEIVANLDITPSTTVKEQRELLENIQQRQETARQAAGLTFVAIDHLPMEAIGHKYDISLRRLIPEIGTEQMFFRIDYPAKDPATGKDFRRNIFVNIGQRSEGQVRPFEGFDLNQATLAFDQADELLDLQAQGILPDLQPDVGGIFNLSTGIMRKPG